MVAAYRPDIAMQVSFNANPNDPSANPIWTDLTALFLLASGTKRGRQYELDQNQGASPTFGFLDRDEFLNPMNPGSPYAPNVVPYRQIVWQAMYPNGGTGNLLNPNGQPGYDMSFESYTVGTIPPGVLRYGNIFPVVTTTNPFQGTKCLTWNVTSGGGLQGINVPFACIPGRPYLVSVYLRQTVANQQDLWLNGHPSPTLQSTTTSGAYVRLSGVFVADQPTLQLVVSTAAPALSGAVNVDGIQLEPLTALNANPGFAQNVGGWTGVNGAGVTVAIESQIGQLSMMVTPNGVTAVPQAQSEEVVVVPGQSYALYGSLQSVAAATRTLGIAWFNSSHAPLSTSSISQVLVAGAWTQYGVQTFTAPAGAVFARVITNDPGTPGSANPWFVDTAMLLTAVPSTFTATGPVIYGVWRGYVERWPSAWDDSGFLGLAKLTAVDSFGSQNLIGLWTEFRNALLAKDPDYYWPLQEPQGATLFGESSGNGGPSLRPWISPAGAGTGPGLAAGTANNMAGDPSGVGVLFAQGFSGATSDVGTMLGTGPAFRSTYVNFPATSTGGAWSMTAVLWAQVTYPISNFDGFLFKIATFLPADGSQISHATLVAFPDGSLTLAIHNDTAANFYFDTGTTAANAINDGKPHLIVSTVTQATNGTTTLAIYLNGTLYVTATGTCGLITAPSTNMEVGGRNDGTTTVGIVGGNLAHIALFSRLLGAAEITDLWNAAKGYPGETSGARVARYLGYGGITQTSVDTGQSIMGVSPLTAGTSLLAANQAVTTTENGNYWVDKTGASTFAARTRRYLATTVSYVFGERTDLGELPYLDDIEFDFDPQLVYNAVVAENAAGITATALSASSQTRYYTRPYQRQINVKDNNEAVDASTYLLNQHKDPHPRVHQITLDPAGHTNLWPVVLGMEIGMRVTVRRRAKAANLGAGLTISADFFIESISHDTVNMKTGEWKTTLYLSPVDVTQVGILDSGTLGLLGSGGARLGGAITATTTSAVVASTGGDLFTTAAAFPATIDSEIVTVTAVAAGGADAFARTVSNGWGSADSGQVWATTGGSASDFSVAPGLGKQVNTSVGTLHNSVIDIGSPDFDITVSLQISINSATTQPQTNWICGRVLDLNNYYVARLDLSTTGVVSLQISKRVASTLSGVVASVNVGTGHLAADVWRVRFVGLGTSLQAWAWIPATSTASVAPTLSGTDSALTTGTQIALLNRLETGNTSTLPVTVSWANLSIPNPQRLTITRPTDGTAGAHTGGAPVQVYQPFRLAY